MKNFLITIFILMSCAMQAQDQYVRIITENNLFRFERVQVNAYTDFSDTLVVERFPEKWLDSLQLKSYQQALIAQQIERQNEIRRLFNIAKREVEVQVAFYDSFNGEGAYLASQKKAMLEALQGKWQLIDRNGTTTNFDITVTGTDFRRNANKFGAITITDDLGVLLTGFYQFDLTFESLANGTLRAIRGERVFILKK